MKIELKEMTIRDLVEDYQDNSIKEEGITGWNGKLDIRPKYQREFVYNDKQRKEVINTIIRDFPLNVMYWVKKEDGTDNYEILDGQQRTISICQYVDGDFSLIDSEGNPKSFYNLTNDEQIRILDYKLMVYFCEGTDKEKLRWFEIINIAGEKLKDQELRNAIYTGEWLTDAKRHFSKTNCPAYQIGDKYVKGSPIQQELLEKALKWISNDNITAYMAKNQHNKDSNELWMYFQDVVNWAKKLFPEPKKGCDMIDWGIIYNTYKDNAYNANDLHKCYLKLIEDEEVTVKTKGIYLYLITGEEKYLSLRVFTDKQKILAYENQKGICTSCENHFDYNEMEGDHIIAWSKGGKTEQTNLQMLCKKCNGSKSNK
jgi:hypothetical protein